MVDDPLAPHLAAHYDLGGERDRLFRDGEPRLELTRTLELLDRFLPPAPARLVDVGGGPGAYAAIWARQGYDVHLYDVLERHVEEAQQAADAQPGHRFTAQVADARSIPEPDASADAVVLLGPLYHLTEPTQLVDEVTDAGFDAVSLLGIEGPGWLMQEHWSDPDRREQMLLAARAVESEPTLSGLSSHLLAVGTKPGAVQPG